MNNQSVERIITFIFVCVFFLMTNYNIKNRSNIIESRISTVYETIDTISKGKEIE